MKILFVTESYWPNMDGGAVFERKLVKGLINRGHILEVWTPGSKLLSYSEKDSNYLILREKSLPLIFNLKYRISYWPFFRIRKIIKNFQPDIIHVHNPALLGLCALYYAKKHHIPHIATNHLMPENILLNIRFLHFGYRFIKKIIWKYLIWFHNQFDYVTSPTQTAINLLKQHGLRVSNQAISNGIDINYYNRNEKLKDIYRLYHIPKKPLLLYFGRLDKEKRIDIIIKAMPTILAQKDIHLIIAGYGNEMNNLQLLAKKLGISSSVTFTGKVREVNKSQLYKISDIFIISSPAELQSIVTLEAMASSKPIVAVDKIALKELVHNNKNGYLFQENNYLELANKCLLLLNNPQKIIDFGKESYQIVKKEHSFKETIKHYENIYINIVNKR